MTVVAGESWILHVAGEGRFGRVWRSAMDNPAVPVERRMSYDEVVARCEPFRELVASAVGISPAEAIEVQQVSYMGRGMADRKGELVRSEILASYATYSRVVDGLPVVGAGSFMKIGIDSEGKFLGFDFDWSEFETAGIAQTTVPNGTLLSRLRKIAPAGDVDQVECGYVDWGTQGDNALGLLQPGCVYNLRSDGGRQTISVPAGSTFVADSRWPESVVLSNPD